MTPELAFLAGMVTAMALILLTQRGIRDLRRPSPADLEHDAVAADFRAAYIERQGHPLDVALQLHSATPDFSIDDAGRIWKRTEHGHKLMAGAL